MVEQAQTRYVRAKKLFQTKQYAAAAEEFAAAYELDPQSKFLLFNLGVARRMAGSCQGAIEAYRAFLAAGPPGQLGDNARIGIERCEKIVASLPPAPPEPATPEPATPEPAKPESRVDPPAAPLRHAAPSQIVSQPREPWYHDRTGDVLTGGGAGFAIASVTLYVLARRDADAMSMPKSLADYEANRTAADQLQIASAITGAAGAVLVVLGVRRW